MRRSLIHLMSFELTIAFSGVPLQSSRSNNLSGRPSIAPSFISEVTNQPTEHGNQGDERYYETAHQVALSSSMTASIPQTRPSTQGRSLSEGDALKQVRKRLVNTDPNIPPAAEPQDNQVPPPKPRSQAPTAYDVLSPTLTSPRSAYTARPSHSGGTHRRADSHHTAGTFSTMPSISIIDFAMAKPLPVSRASSSPKTGQVSQRTLLLKSYGSANPVQGEFDEDKMAEIHSKKGIKREPVPPGPAPIQGSQGCQASHGPMDPRKIPLPASRPPTRARASSESAGLSSGLD